MPSLTDHPVEPVAEDKFYQIAYSASFHPLPTEIQPLLPRRGEPFSVPLQGRPPASPSGQGVPASREQTIPWMADRQPVARIDNGKTIFRVVLPGLKVAVPHKPHLGATRHTAVRGVLVLTPHRTA